MKLPRTARTILSVTALAWSIPFAQSAFEQPDAEEVSSAQELREWQGPVRNARYGAERPVAGPAHDPSASKNGQAQNE